MEKSGCNVSPIGLGRQEERVKEKMSMQPRRERE